MSALALRLLLILSLVFNAVAAPWAMAGMQHDGHAHAGAAAAVVPVQDMQQHVAGHDHAMMSHTSPHDHAAMLQTSRHDHASMPDEGDTHGSASCCDGAMCQCGCILPPAVTFAATLTLEPQPSLPIDMTHVALAIVARGSPPFRPPAV